MAMDVPRGKEVARRKLIRRIIYIAILLAAIPLITWGLSRLKPAAPSVDAATVWKDTVKRGPMVRDVRGLGTLVVEAVHVDSGGVRKPRGQDQFSAGRDGSPQRGDHGAQRTPDMELDGGGPGMADQGGPGQLGESAGDARDASNWRRKRPPNR